MEKVVVFCKRRANKSILTSFGEIKIDEEGYAEIDEKDLDKALEIGFTLVESIPEKEDLEGDQSPPDKKPPLTPDEELEVLKISLFKKKNEELEALLAEAEVPEKEYKGKVKKDLVEILFEKLTAK